VRARHEARMALYHGGVEAGGDGLRDPHRDGVVPRRRGRGGGPADARRRRRGGEQRGGVMHLGAVRDEPGQHVVLRPRARGGSRGCATARD
jgi:hypothetical protein